MGNPIRQTKVKGFSVTLILWAVIILFFLTSSNQILSIAIVLPFLFAVLSINKQIRMTFEKLEISKKNKLEKSLPYSSIVSISLNQVGLFKRTVISVNTTESNDVVIFDLNDFTKKDLRLIINSLLEKNPKITLEDATKAFITSLN